MSHFTLKRLEEEQQKQGLEQKQDEISGPFTRPIFSTFKKLTHSKDCSSDRNTMVKHSDQSIFITTTKQVKISVFK